MCILFNIDFHVRYLFIFFFIYLFAYVILAQDSKHILFFLFILFYFRSCFPFLYPNFGFVFVFLPLYINFYSIYPIFFSISFYNFRSIFPLTVSKSFIFFSIFLFYHYLILPTYLLFYDWFFYVMTYNSFHFHKLHNSYIFLPTNIYLLSYFRMLI